MQDDPRFSRRLYTVPEAARLVGMSPSTLRAWTASRDMPSHNGAGRQPVVTALDRTRDNRSIPFVGLVEAHVVQAFRQTGLSMQRIRLALDVLRSQGELDHALASKRLYGDGADVLYDYACRQPDKQLRLLTIVQSGQQVFHDVIKAYLDRIVFGDTWARELILGATEHKLLRVVPEIENGRPLFLEGGAPLSAVRSRLIAGEPIDSVSCDYGVPRSDIEEAVNAIWPKTLAA